MAETFYAWSPIRGDEGIVAKFGDEVTAEGLDVEDEDFEAMKEANVIRRLKPPELPEGYQGSVMDYYRDLVKEASLAQGSSIEEASLAAFHSTREAAGQPPLAEEEGPTEAEEIS
jgi:hypothetical protein